jgi:hypothetical protein
MKAWRWHLMKGFWQDAFGARRMQAAGTREKPEARRKKRCFARQTTQRKGLHVRGRWRR